MHQEMWEKLKIEVGDLADRYQDNDDKYTAYTSVLDLIHNIEIDHSTCSPTCTHKHGLPEVSVHKCFGLEG